MAEIKPLRAWRYNNKLGASIDELTSPPFDVVSEKQRQALYKNPFNSIHLSVPLEPDPADRAAKTLQKWKDEGIIIQDHLPGIYVYFQYFKFAGSAKEFCRKGIICNIRADDWDQKVILRHENTIPKAVNDREELLEKTMLHASPTHGLYTDPTYEIEGYMDQAILNPIYETEDYQGVRDVLAIIQDAAVINKIINNLKHKTIILADGHHRYESSLILKHKKLREAAEATGDEGYNFHMMFLSNTETDDLRILPTHRVIKNLPDFTEEKVLRKLALYFSIKPVEDPESVYEIIHGKPWTFGLLFGENAYKIRLQPEAFFDFHWPFPDLIKKLDLTVMHYFIIEKALGITGKEQRESNYLDFDRSFSDCLARVNRKEAQMAIITQEVSIEDVKRVCQSGHTMPQKSTYFYPKVICGFLFGSIQEDEFKTPPYSPF
ncbi:MAG: DUF1015 domain-containing protein [Cyclobacteriaceae bacterium]|nr:DUF1015 domain-containing protein [Cyclobacteriaceae bacterium]